MSEWKQCCFRCLHEVLLMLHYRASFVFWTSYSSGDFFSQVGRAWTAGLRYQQQLPWDFHKLRLV
jgi:hypothetical protein